jgi:hypothetical protein
MKIFYIIKYIYSDIGKKVKGSQNRPSVAQF